MSKTLPTESTYGDKRIAAAPYRRTIPRQNGGEPLEVFSFRPLDRALADMLKDAIRCCKPVPSVFGNNHEVGRPDSIATS